ncbi:hypothetical protein MPL1032_70073 [Mesorhizobium plurifarium]|uniref:Uncharacterized protein n=1 Tax=Mesorhizobium plurifarium TaxID=69974 RepID=A0A0K2W761_MESPL|nr:hypothetical protein MPL1032_70073 [Mesorhizobium plurifarium]
MRRHENTGRRGLRRYAQCPSRTQRDVSIERSNGQGRQEGAAILGEYCPQSQLGRGETIDAYRSNTGRRAPFQYSHVPRASRVHVARTRPNRLSGVATGRPA